MIARIIEFCAKNRAFVLFAVAFAAVGSIFAIRNAKLDAIPDLSDPQVIVFTEWMGRSPPLVEDQVTYPIVSGLISTPKVKDVRGYSMFGMSFVYVVFEEGTDLYWGRSRVLEYLNAIRGRMPEGVTPVLGPDATGVGWVLEYVVTDKSGKHGLDELRAFQDYTLRYAIGSVPGVAEVATVGGFEKQYQVTVDPDRLRSFEVTVLDVSNAVRDANNDVGARVLEISGREYFVRGKGYLRSVADVEAISLKVTPRGTPVRIGDVARVAVGPDIRRGALDWNGEGEAVGGIVVMRYGENALDVIARVKQRLTELKASFPEGVEVQFAYDRAPLIERSVDTLKHALIEEVVVVAAVIVLFLLHIRSSLLPIFSLPIAVALSFIPMYLLDIPSTIMSLGGIAIAIGATVDAEIVMIEASHKKLEHLTDEKDRSRLLAEAAREVTPAIFFSLLIIAVAFLPVFTLTGQAGRLFRPMAYTKTFVMLISAILSITFAPAMREFLLKGKIRPESQHPISRAIIKVYKPFVFVALRRPVSTIAIGAFALVSAIPLYLKLGHEFMPPLNEGDMLYMPITMPNVSIEEARRGLQLQDRVLRSLPEVESVFGKVGRAESPTDPAPLTMVETVVRLRPQEQWRKTRTARWYSNWAPHWLKVPLRRVWPEERSMTWEQLAAEMNSKMRFPGWTNAYTMPIKTRIDMLSTGVRTPVGVKVQGASLDEIERAGTELEAVLTKVPGTRSVVYERNLGGLYVDIVPRRDALARFGLSMGEVERTIEAAIGGAPVTVTIEGRKRFSVNVRYPQDARDDVEKLRRVLISIGGAPAGGGNSMEGKSGRLERRSDEILLAQMDGTPMPSRASLPAQGPPSPNEAVLSDVPGSGVGVGPDVSSPAAPKGFVLLGDIADVQIASGPPMVRDEMGLLTGYVFVDVDTEARDIGGYVHDAKAAVAAGAAKGDVRLPAGVSLKWTGQYELLEQMSARMKIVVPVTLLLTVLLLYFQFKNFIEVLIILLSIPFALIGSVWLMWLLDYRVSTAVWVGVIALVGLAAQTGVVMIVYIDHAFERRREAGMIRNLEDIIWAHMEGTVQRVRPKLMTVGTMLIGLVPLLWAEGSGADVMRRVAVPMIGGLLTSAFLTLEIIPVIYTYWRFEELLWERLNQLRSPRLALLQWMARLHGAGWALLVSLAVIGLYVTLPPPVSTSIASTAAACLVVSAAIYLMRRPGAKRVVWS